jgi:hypothetical protein
MPVEEDTMKTLTLLLSLVVAGCVSIPSPFGSGVYVIADGGRTTAPVPGGRAIVYYRAGTPQWENSQQLVQTAITTWLQKRGVTVLTVARNVILEEQKFRLIYTGDGSPLKIGKLHGADLVVCYFFTENANQISVEAVEVETGVIARSGSALSNISYRESPRQMSLLIGDNRGPLVVNPVAMRTLACHAMAAAWGLEPPGEYDLYRDEAC